MLTANLGLAIAKMKKTTVVLDASLMTPNLGLMFKLEKVLFTLNDVLAGEASLGDVIYDGPFGLKIIPAGVTLEQIKKARPARLPEVLHELPVKADFLLIDAPGGLRSETISALRSGNEVLLVTVPEIASTSGAMKTRLIAEFLGLKPIGIVINRVHDEEFELKGDEISRLLNLQILAKIPEDNIVRKALTHGKNVVDAYPNSPSSKAINKLAEKILKMKIE
jgi:septum site-determining protein MinD